MAVGDGWTMDDVEVIFEIQGLYDGWSWAMLKDGSAVNRWPEGDRRYQPTEDYIAKWKETYS